MSDPLERAMDRAAWSKLLARAEAAEARLAAIEAVVGPAKEAVRELEIGTWQAYDDDSCWGIVDGEGWIAGFDWAVDRDAAIAAVNAIRALSEADKDRQIAATEREEG